MSQPQQTTTVGRFDVLFLRLLDHAVASQQNPLAMAVYQQHIRPIVKDAAEQYLSSTESAR